MWNAIQHPNGGPAQVIEDHRRRAPPRAHVRQRHQVRFLQQRIGRVGGKPMVAHESDPDRPARAAGSPVWSASRRTPARPARPAPPVAPGCAAGVRARAGPAAPRRPVFGWRRYRAAQRDRRPARRQEHRAPVAPGRPRPARCCPHSAAPTGRDVCGRVVQANRHPACQLRLFLTQQRDARVHPLRRCVQRRDLAPCRRAGSAVRLIAGPARFSAQRSPATAASAAWF